jgi:hypothetical protein
MGLKASLDDLKKKKYLAVTGNRSLGRPPHNLVTVFSHIISVSAHSKHLFTDI